MGKVRCKAPSPAMVVAIIALVLAVAGSAVAGIATVSVLTKKEKKQTKTIADNEVNRLAPSLSVKSADTANSAANASQLGGIGAGGFVQGGGRQVQVRGYMNNGGDVVLIDVAGVGNLSADCTNSAQDVALTYTNTSGADQVAGISVVNSDATGPTFVTGDLIGNNETQVEGGHNAITSRPSAFTVDAAPATSTGAPSFSFRGSAWTKVGGDLRCVVSGVATIG